MLGAIGLSLGVAACATRSRWSWARSRRSRWRGGSSSGKETLTLLFVLPIALPGIITGIALLSAIKLGELEPGFWTIVAGHATFCIVIVYNNVVARLRRMPPQLDRGVDGPRRRRLQTFRYVLLPQMATALLAGGMLAFALSFDEIIVTIFTAGPRAHAADLVPQRAVPAARPARSPTWWRVHRRSRVTLVADRARYYPTRPAQRSPT